MLELRPIFDAIGEFLNSILPEFWVTIVSAFGTGAIILGVASVFVLFFVWWERKVSAHMQQRYGPMRTGWHGWLQTIADGVKLLQKEDLIPRDADKLVYLFAPVVCFVAAFLAYVTIPFGEGLIVQDLNIGILYIIAITTFTVVSLLMAGWASHNKWSLLGGMRSAAQIISYEVPLSLSLIGVIMIAETLSMVSIVVQQEGWFWNWYVFRQPLGFIVYYIAATAEANRTPFDIPEAEQELVAGYNVEYSGMKWAMFFFAEYINMLTISAIAVTLFFGGWHAPAPFLDFIPSWIWFVGKCLLSVFVLMWFRWTYPRVRVDQLMAFAWKFMLPLAFVNIILTGFGIYLF
ncbi:MAG: NADH-quinone oxidoreductase subunit NuoH [candidate division Zixibacteria bacterium]|nr:NADH-quinone oxidoreductase subunit NuoH [candidate division Zixibacteria bacterium]